MSDSNQDLEVIEWVVEIVSSYVSNNSVPASELPALLSSVHDALKRISGEPEEVPQQPPSPAVPLRKSVADDHIVCLEDGKQFKSLKRHLQTVHGMTPDQYRERWGLNRDYPMVAPAYAKARSALAKGMGLGASRRRSATEDVEELEEVVDVVAAEPELELDAGAPPAPASGRKPRAAKRSADKT